MDMAGAFPNNMVEEQRNNIMTYAHSKHTQTGTQAGFTLVELSIVLVIIGLIVGGVLVGQDMIRAAEIRSTIAQVEKYNTAVNTFRDKYANLPGDMLSSDATRFGFTARGGAATNRGDGDRLLEAPGSGLLLGTETGLFWRDLSQVALIDNGFATITDGGSGLGNGGAAITLAEMDRFLPQANLGLGHYITVHSAGGRNYFQVSRVTAVSNAGAYTLESALSPQTAFNVDDKLDDGNPTNGSVNAAWTGGAAPHPLNATLANAGGTLAFGADNTTQAGCASDPTVDGTFVYNTATEAGANMPACQLRIRAAF
jgi:prepilin-type N-terminal cleavage/methylation domain-containing protein